ncbi:hypothetical protein WICPIJ_004240 [Wickerhamomyces pijperi]|uniref:Condensin complex subunit 2 n=1 Tax=Wickerhamomyces pijperi TaxID=599730 RepID=A0A9P8Q681_WICPI|nr:hypothetical protein WICPIJ_004240 [Wickerhamomyces pijperi]
MTEQLPVAPQSQDFEKWLRMATDNKINTQNSWNLSLIDYFHDLTFLKDGDNVNFQKASATLDGCVKIYVSRVDSAATETGKLLNGLSSEAQKKKGGNHLQEGDNEEGEVLDEDLVFGRTKRALNKNIVKKTLVSFDVIKVKNGDLEVYVDPLIKKSIAEFDEGGTKSLLLNMLNINNAMKLALDTTDTAEVVDLGCEDDDTRGDATVKYPDILTDLSEEPNVLPLHEDLDSTDQFAEPITPEQRDYPVDAQDQRDEEQSTTPLDPDHTLTEEQMTDYIIGNIGKLADMFSTIIRQSTLESCSSLKELKDVIDNKRAADDLLKELESMDVYHIPSTPSNMQVIYDDKPQDFSFGGDNFDYYDTPDQEEEDLANTSKFNSIFFDDDMDDEIDNFGISMRMLFNQEKSFIDAREATMIEQQENDEKTGAITNIPDDNLLAYFDNNQKHNWAGPEHWKIQKVKKSFNYQPLNQENNEEIQDPEELDENGNVIEKDKVEKAKFTIDFMSDLDIPAREKFMLKDRPQILRVADMTSKTHHVLPDDKNFTTKNFIKLFIKDQVIHSRFNSAARNDDIIGASIFADSIHMTNHDSTEINNADFFNDHSDNDGYDDYDVGYGDYDAYGNLQQTQSAPSVSASQKNEPLAFSRVAKRVDVRLLKDNLWNTLSQEVIVRNTQASQAQMETTSNSSHRMTDEVRSPPRKRPTLVPLSQPEDPLKFSDIVQDLGMRYDTKARSDISTSFCFISLLHLANEKGFAIESTKGNKDLLIKDIPHDFTLIPHADNEL